jgi:ceramide glucosyltransferase
MDFVLYFGWVLFAASLGYLSVAVYCVLAFGNKVSRSSVALNERPGVTLHKPLCGLEYGLKQNLLSFCRQDYPDFQVVFGVADANDPAISVVHDVMSECPDVISELVINGLVARQQSEGQQPHQHGRDRQA